MNRNNDVNQGVFIAVIAVVVVIACAAGYYFFLAPKVGVPASTEQAYKQRMQGGGSSGAPSTNSSGAYTGASGPRGPGMGSGGMSSGGGPTSGGR